MKKIAGLIGVIILVINMYGQKNFQLPNDNQDITLKNLSSTTMEININLNEIKILKKQIDGQYYLVIENDLTEKTQGNGEPMLPVITRLIELPAEAKIKVKSVRYSSYKINLGKEFGNIPIIPAQPPRRKDITDNHLVINKNLYTIDEFINKNIVDFHSLGWMRTMRLGEITIKPFNYNPWRNILTVYDKITITIEFVNPDWTKTQEIKSRYASPVYQFKDITINRLPKSKALLQNLPLKMIIVTPDEFITGGLMQFVRMKERQGFDVVIAPTSQIGSDTASIRNWLKNYYETNSHPQDFVLFIGDVDKLPSWPQRTQDQHVTDLYYCEYTGDYLPEVYWGRFPAGDTTQLWNIIQKTLDYEQLNLPNLDYFSTTLLVAGNDESMEDTYGNGQVYYGQTYYFNPNNGITGHALYQDPPAGSSYQDTIINLINNGCGFANYSAHCSPDGWADPSFSRSDITNNLQTNRLYGVWIGNCCQSNKFDEEDAFGEIAVYSANKGAVAYIGGSDYTYWDEDYWWAVGYTQSITATPSYDNSTEGAFDGYFHTLQNEASDPSKWFITTAQMIWAGNLAVEQSTSNLKHYYWEIYQVMGDPSLIPFVGPVQQITITASSPIIKGTNEALLATAPYTYLTIYQDGMRIGTGISDNSGMAHIITNVTISSDTLTIYGYGQNKTPVQVKIGTVNPDFPLAETKMLTSHVDFASSGTLTLTVQNTNDTASLDEVYILLTSLNTQALTLAQDSIYIGLLAAAGTDTITVGYTSYNVADMTSGQIMIATHQIYNSDTLILQKLANINVYAPAPQITEFLINDTDGSSTLDSAETGTISVVITNTGHANADNLTAAISADTSLIHFGNTPVNIGTLATGDTLSLTFTFSCDSFSNPVAGKIFVSLYNNLINKEFEEKIWFGKPTYMVLSNGNGITSEYPFNNYWKYGETQILITKEELKYLKTVNEIALRIQKSYPGGYYFKNFKIALLDTNLAQLSTWIDTSLFTTIYDNSNYHLGDYQGWWYFHTSDWQVDTSKDLIVYIFWGQNPSYVAQDEAYAVYGENTPFTSVLYKNYDYLGGGNEQTYTSPLRPAIKIGKAEISAVESMADNKLNIFPNPAHEYIQINLPDNRPVAQAEVINTQGQVVIRSNLIGTRLNIKSLTPGIYLLRIRSGGIIYSTKFIKE